MNTELTNGTDIFWTLTSGTPYNTIFKILFLGSQAYTIYLMLNDYKPTHDPNIDTFKVQYLLGASAVIAVLFPYKYQVTEVRSPFPFPSHHLTTSPDPMGILNLARIRRHPPSTLHAAAHRRSRDNHDPLPLRLGFVPRSLHSQLAVPLFRGGIR